MEKIEIYVRFANEGTYYNKIMVDPSKIKTKNVFKDEVFVEIDNTTVAIKREDWDKIEYEISR